MLFFTQSLNSIDELSMCPTELLKQIGDEEGFSVTYVTLKNDQSKRLITLKVIKIIIILCQFYSLQVSEF